MTEYIVNATIRDVDNYIFSENYLVKAPNVTKADRFVAIYIKKTYPGSFVTQTKVIKKSEFFNSLTTVE